MRRPIAALLALTLLGATAGLVSGQARTFPGPPTDTDPRANTPNDPDFDLAEPDDEDGDFVKGRVVVEKSADFKTPANVVIADATPERKFVRELTSRENALKVDAWLKNTPMGFYSVEYAWKKGNKPKRGEFSPDFFIKQGESVFVVEVKGDEEISDPAADNIKKHEYATEHFKRLNDWLEREKIPTRYQFNMISPKSYNVFFQKLRNGGLAGFRSELDVGVAGAGNGEG